MRDFQELSARTGYAFKDRSLLELALTHPSFSGEMRKSRIHSNQRLEFLGDAVLELVVSEYLYKEYPESDEGELTRMRSSLVFEAALFLCARKIGLQDHLLLGKGEEMSGGRNKPSVVSDAFEAYTGAVYLDGGFEEAREFISRNVLGCIDAMELLHDSKSKLQEQLQKTDTPFHYNTFPADDPTAPGFVCILSIAGDQFARAEGHSKKEAEQNAAAIAIKKLKDQGI